MLQAMSRAFWPSSRHSIWLVTMMLLLTYSPTGSACSISFLYVSMSGASDLGEPIAKHSTPSPMRAAFSNVLGLPAATQSGGWGLV